MIKKPLDLRKGFTLIEMVMVLVIIGILATIVVPQFSAQMDAAKAAQTQANLSTLRTAVALYIKRNNGNPPMQLQDLGTPGGPPDNAPAILYPVPSSDGWGQMFQYSQSDGSVSCASGSTKCHTDW